jgi:ABC-type multidrug transport system fused ATPase/permease subunit
MPALQEIFSAVTKIRFTMPVLGLVEKSLNSAPEFASKVGKKQGVLKLKNNLCLKNISFRYFGSSFDALKNITLVVKANTTVGIVGPTGSGKTTLVDLVLGLLRPSEGKIYIDGEELNQDNLSTWQADIGYVPQSIYLSDDTIERNIAFGVPEHEIDFEQIKKVARLAQIDEFIESQLPKAYKTFVGERGVRLSGGQRQRIGVARALYHGPDLLVFDEATSALDDETEKALIDSIERLSGQKTILMIAHRLSTLERADQTIRIEKGMIVTKTSQNSEIQNA